MDPRSVLITGCSTGIGRLLAPALAGRGHRPVASMRDPSGRNHEAAKAMAAHGIEVVDIDVTDEASVARGVGQAGRIDVLVNNAGFGIFGPVESATVDDLKLVFETNVYGAHRMVRAVLPQMRGRRDGLLVHVSSGAGRLAFPGAGAYCASKWALEALGETLRYELAPLGIDSVLVEPGRYDTDFHHRSLQRTSDAGRLEPYEFLGPAAARRIEATPAGDPDDVIQAIVRLIEMPRGTRPTRTVVQPGGARSFEPLNELQSEVAKRVLTMFGEERFADNGV